MTVNNSRAEEGDMLVDRPHFDAMRLFYQSTLDAMSPNVAVLNARGTIVSVNIAWVRFIETHKIDEVGLAMGENFLDLCDRKSSEAADFEIIRNGMRALFEGGPGPFRHDYLCPWIGDGHWSRMSAVRVGSMRTPFVIVSHEDITEQRQARRRELDITGRLLLAEDEERRRIGRELHDGAAQKLAAAKLILARGPEACAEAQEVIAEAIVELRALADRLHPPILEPLGLCAAIRRHVTRLGREAGFSAVLDTPEDLPRLARPIEITLYRAVQAALENIVRHSGSHQAELSLTTEGDIVRLSIRDHGRGAAAGLRDGDGLAGLRLRVEQLGGAVSITEAEPGLRLTVELPLQVAEPAEA